MAGFDEGGISIIVEMWITFKYYGIIGEIS